MPPIAKKGWGALCAAWETSSRPTPGRPSLVGVSQTGPDADVVDGRLGGGGDLLLGVGREADDRLRAEQLAGLGRRGVVLADVDAVGVAGAGQLGVVVDDEEGAVGVAEAAEGERRQLDLAPRQLLLAQLDDVDAAARAPRAAAARARPRRLRVADEVEARRAQPLAAQRAGGLWWSKAHLPDYGLPGADRG